MPVVGNRHFAYTPEGEAAAKKYGKSVGKPVRKGYRHGGETKKYFKGDLDPAYTWKPGKPKGKKKK
jgi:hypothetical protein